MKDNLIDFLARRNAKEQQGKQEKTNDKAGNLAKNDDPEKFIESIMGKVAEKLGNKDKKFLTIFNNMMQIEKLPSSPSTDATEEIQVKDYTRDQCIKHLLESSHLDWDTNASFYKAVARRFRALSKYENE